MEDENDTNHSGRERGQKLLGGNQLVESRLATEKTRINGLSEPAEGNSLDKYYKEQNLITRNEAFVPYIITFYNMTRSLRK